MQMFLVTQLFDGEHGCGFPASRSHDHRGRCIQQREEEPQMAKLLILKDVIIREEYSNILSIKTLHLSLQFI